jgi:hypothetical protein
MTCAITHLGNQVKRKIKEDGRRSKRIFSTDYDQPSNYTFGTALPWGDGLAEIEPASVGRAKAQCCSTLFGIGALLCLVEELGHLEATISSCSDPGAGEIQGFGESSRGPGLGR